MAAVPKPGEPVPDVAARSAALLIGTARQLIGQPGARLWGITAGVRESTDEAHLAGSAMWGLGRVLAGEQDDLWCGTIDLPGEGLPGADLAAVLLDVLRSDVREDVVAIRDGAAFASRLRRAESPATGDPVSCRPDGTYLITGGLGRLGLEVAAWLAGRGARRLILAGRQGLPPRSAWADPADPETRRRIDGVRALEARGMTVRVIGLDVADAGAAARELSPDATGLPPIAGVVHAAGVLEDRLATDVDEKSLRTVLRPKADGAWVLHRLFPPGSFDFMVLFSSCGQLLGLPGQATYGAANTFLDALAAHRPDTTSLGLTSWRGYGMAVNEATDRWLRSQGVTDISAAGAFSAWDRAARTGTGYVAVLRTVPLTEGQERGPLLRDLATGPETDGNRPSGGSFTGLSREELGNRVLRWCAPRSPMRCGSPPPPWTSAGP
ncbi:SDR family oxidoreductase [Micromonospora endolithica]|uniref:SDR family oxidoreductase n=1 Tax=Micromonospora endolithica TaxID=230091 RepID=UPI00192DBC16|nr:SDR family oxidoreductase [Micromonospora endolithica]